MPQYGQCEYKIELSASDKHRWDESRVYPRKEFKMNPQGLHVGELWESYPIFDSCDASDDRSNDNFIIRQHPITVADLKLLNEVRRGMNACRVKEYIPANLLPIIYHDGDSEYILVTTRKFGKYGSLHLKSTNLS